MEPKQTDTRPTLKEGCEKVASAIRQYGITAEEFCRVSNEFSKAAREYHEAIKQALSHDTDKKI